MSIPKNIKVSNEIMEMIANKRWNELVDTITSPTISKSDAHHILKYITVNDMFPTMMSKVSPKKIDAVFLLMS